MYLIMLEGGTSTPAVSEPPARLDCYRWVKPLVDGELAVGLESLLTPNGSDNNDCEGSMK